ncbi:MAG: rRNA maturation RNase YbeY [bacterium]
MMTLPSPPQIQITYSDSLEINENFESFVKNVLKEKDIHTGIIDIRFVNETEICRLHKEYLGQESVTDIVTFNLGDQESPMADLYICYEQAKRQAKQYKQSLEKELKRLIIHGILHCCGYDDIKEEDRERMENEQEKLLEKLGDISD